MITDAQINTLLTASETIATSAAATTKTVNALSVSTAVLAEQVVGLRSDINEIKIAMSHLPCEDEKIARVQIEERMRHLAKQEAASIVTPQIREQAEAAALTALDQRTRSLLIKAIGYTGGIIAALVMGVVEFLRSGR